MFSTHLILLFISICSSMELSQNIEVSVTGIRNNKGYIIISAFKDQATFEKEKPFFSKKFDKKDMQNQTLIAKFHLEEGIYGFALLDDENNNSKMDYSFLGIPEEGFGFSNYYHTGLSRPKFNAFQLQVNKQLITKSTMKIRYM